MGCRLLLLPWSAHNCNDAWRRKGGARTLWQTVLLCDPLAGARLTFLRQSKAAGHSPVTLKTGLLSPKVRPLAATQAADVECCIEPSTRRIILLSCFGVKLVPHRLQSDPAGRSVALQLQKTGVCRSTPRGARCCPRLIASGNHKEAGVRILGDDFLVRRGGRQRRPLRALSTTVRCCTIIPV
ncbi:hypothetical protein MRX96_037413 [Rhipicephalus microplus]